MQCIVRPAAAADIDDAFLWYEGQRAGLGHDGIAEHPLRYPVIRRNTRRALLRRFPYAIYYRVYGDVIVVVACMHGRRDPRRWQVRR
jgi:plasmid stabilization system protein ParE